jgi:uncharacterized protein (DUF924 family)
MSLSQAWLLSSSSTAAAALIAAMGLRVPEPIQPTPDTPVMAARTSATAQQVAQQVATPAEALAVVDFWREAGLQLWFAKDADFDRRFRERFLSLYEAAARGDHATWLETPHGALALILLLDQFPRNSFRNTPRMYATDDDARVMAHAAIAAGHDHGVEPQLRVFFYLPFGHSEDVADQDYSVSLCEHLGEPVLAHAKHHRDIIRRFGRFPHRNPILGRPMRPEEQRFLDEGGFAG